MKIKKTIAILITAALAAGLLAGCGDSAPNSASSVEAEPVAVDSVTFRAEDGTIILNSTHIRNVKPTKSDGDNYAVLLTFTKDGAEILAAATANMLGQTMSLYIYEEQVFSAQLTTAILSGELLIGGNYTQDKADSIAEDVKAGLRREPLPTMESAEIPQGTIAPGDFPDGWNDIMGTVAVEDFSIKIKEIDPDFTYVENPLSYRDGTALTQWGWSNGKVAVVPYQIDSLEPQAWSVTFGKSGEMETASIVLYENTHATFFWLDEEKGEMSAPLACALWLAAEGILNTTTLSERGDAWEDVREFIKTVSIMARELGYEFPERGPAQ